MTWLANIKDKQILVLGAGITGMSCVRYLSAQGLSFAVNDSRATPFSTNDGEKWFKANFPTASLHLGKWHSELIHHADIILISPGIDSSNDEIVQHIRPECQVFGDIELFCQLNNQGGLNEQGQSVDILAVTGSNGKSTVVSLLSYLAEQIGVDAQLGGNIGQPILDIITRQKDGKDNHLPDLLILELSSFQLETLSSMQALATSVLNVSDDHLDRHHNMEKYKAIKQGIYQQGQVAVTNRDDAATQTPNKSQTVVSFGSDQPNTGEFGLTEHKGQFYLAFGEQPLIAVDKLPLAGIHNALNYLAALALGYSAGWTLTDMVANLAGFEGLAHRCQRVPSQDGITWINDSKATNVGATIAAINGLAPTLISTNNHNKRLFLIAGGEGKGADFTPMVQPLTEHVSHMITLGKDGNNIAKLVMDNINTTHVTSLSEAVSFAKKMAQPGDIVLLSPACASLDMFKNFAERGEQFMTAVMTMAEAS